MDVKYTLIVYIDGSKDLYSNLEGHEVIDLIRKIEESDND